MYFGPAKRINDGREIDNGDSIRCITQNRTGFVQEIKGPFAEVYFDDDIERCGFSYATVQTVLYSTLVKLKE